MIAADTNVWARAYLNDDAAQARKARSAIETGCRQGGIFVPLLILAELFWVLRSRWDKDRVLQALEHLLKTNGVVIESQEIAAKALEESRTGSAGFADLLLAEISLANGVSEIITFDKAFARKRQVRRLT